MCWRGRLRVGEALALAEIDLDPSRGAILIRRGKGGKCREVGMTASDIPENSTAPQQPVSANGRRRRDRFPLRHLPALPPTHTHPVDGDWLDVI